MSELFLELRIDPVHLSTQLGADDLHLVTGLLGAHALEVLLARSVLRDPFAREVARLDLGQQLLHRPSGLDRSPACRASGRRTRPYWRSSSASRRSPSRTSGRRS